MSFLSAINEGRLRMVEMMKRRGAPAPDGATDVYATAQAARRCVFCSTKEECDAWLASGQTQGSERFCPNAEFIAYRARTQGK